MQTRFWRRPSHATPTPNVLGRVRALCIRAPAFILFVPYLIDSLLLINKNALNPFTCHCERPTGAWQSHFVTLRLLRRSTPRNDTLLIAFILVSGILTCTNLIIVFIRYFVSFSHLFRNGLIRSIGTGNIIVEFFSVAISVRVWRNLSCKADGAVAMIFAASTSFCEAWNSPSA